MFWILFYIFLIVIGIYIIYYVIKFHNPYTCDMYIGLPGVGKSTFIVAESTDMNSKGWNCYSSEETIGCYHLDPKNDFGVHAIAPHSAVFVDEVGLIFDNRNYKDFKPEVKEFFKKHRHYKVKIYLFSQSFDVDKKIRDVTDNIYILYKYLGVLTVAKKVRTKLVAVQPDGEHEGRIGTSLELTPWWMAPFGARKFVWLPKWYKYFDSYEHKDLIKKEYKFIEYPEGFKLHQKRKFKINLPSRSGIRNPNKSDLANLSRIFYGDDTSKLTNISAGSGEAAADDHKK